MIIVSSESCSCLTTGESYFFSTCFFSTFFGLKNGLIGFVYYLLVARLTNGLANFDFSGLSSGFKIGDKLGNLDDLDVFPKLVPMLVS